MSLFNAIIFGLIQGATEFLPVSSSGHLYLTSMLMGCEPDIGYFIWLHVGTLIAVLIKYGKSFAKILFHPSKPQLWFLVTASVPTFVMAVIYKLFVPQQIERYLLPFGFLLTAVLLLLTHGLSKKANNNETEKKNFSALKMGYKRSVFTGIAQGLAVIPGLSRSGTTVSTMQLMGAERTSATEFSFLLSIPVIIGGAVADILAHMLDGNMVFAHGIDFSSVQGIFESATLWVNPFVGIVVSALTGILALSLFERLVKRNSLYKFAFYLPIPMLISVLLW